MKTMLLLFVLLTTLSAKTVVTLRSETYVSQERVRLNDVATVSGTYAEQLRSFEVARAAQPGYARMVVRDELFLFANLSEEIKNDIELAGAVRCRVVSSGKSVTLSDIGATVADLLKSELQWESNECEISFRDSLSAIATVWDKPYEIELGKLRSSALKGEVMIPVRIVQGEMSSRISVQTKIAVQTTVAVAARQLVPGETISAGDIVWQTMDITNSSFTPMTAFQAGATYTVSGGVVKAGTVVTVNRLKKNKVIAPGDPVTVVAQAGKVTVTLSGRAREAGDIGERIAVENSVSKKIIRGIVIKPGVVRVHKGGEA